MAKKADNIISTSTTENLIYQIRGQRVMLDSDLAALYSVQTKVLNQAVRRNPERFPEDFMFQLTWEETERFLRSQIVTLDAEIGEISSKKRGSSRSQIVTLNKSKSHRGRNVKYQPYVFTEQGVAMLSSVLRSPRAVQVNIEIMRAFVKIRQWLASNADLSRRLDNLEKQYDQRFKIVFDALRELTKPAETPKREIGFHAGRNPQNGTKALAKYR